MKQILVWNEEYRTLEVERILSETEDAALVFEDFVLQRAEELLGTSREETRRIIADDHDDSISLYMTSACIRFAEFEEVISLQDVRVNQLNVNTNAGKILATENADPGAPGFSITLIPKGFNAEIDLSYIEVKQDPDYIRPDTNVTVEDVCIYSYGDPFTDDCTHQDVVRRSEVQKALCDEIEKELTKGEK